MHPDTLKRKAVGRHCPSFKCEMNGSSFGVKKYLETNSKLWRKITKFFSLIMMRLNYQ